MLGARIFNFIFWGFILVVYIALVIAASPLIILSQVGDEMNGQDRY